MRSFWAFIALGVAAGLLIVADPTIYLNRQILNSGAFANRAVDSLDKPEVRRQVSEQISDSLKADLGGLGVPSTAVDAVVEKTVATDEFRALFHRAAVRVQRVALSDNRKDVTLVIEGLGPLLHDEVARIDPVLAGYVPANIDIQVAALSKQVNDALGDLARFSHKSRLIAHLTFIFGMLAAIGSVLLNPDRRSGLIRVSLLFSAIGVLFVVLSAVARSAAIDRVASPELHPATGAVWDAYFGDFRADNIVIALLGAAVAAILALYPRIREARSAGAYS